MSKVKFKYENGDLLEDIITGLQGICRVRAEYDTGCHHYGLQPRKLTKEGDTKAWVWLDQSQLKRVKKGVVKTKIKGNKTSGSLPAGPE